MPQIAQAAAAHFQATGALCTTSPAVPASVPMGFGYKTSPFFGMDFHAGDAENGWNCLNFAIDGGIHCRFRYAIQQDFVGPAVGGPDPGMTGFEVSAEGDDDGDTLSSTFTIVGTLDPQTGTYTLSPLFKHNPTE